MGDSYCYSPLNSAPRTTRLLRVLPQPGKTIHISLENALLDQLNGQYDAISYVWGKDIPCRHVVIDGKKLQVRDNIYQCLKHLRRHQMISKPLWIDCICINQADREEKARQIANMAEIFSLAKTVYVWLGKTSSRFAPEQNLAHKLLGKALLHDSGPGSLRDMFFGDMLELQHPIAYAVVDQLMRLVYDEYWHRVWIIQEVAHASDARVVMGDMLIDAHTMVHIYLTIRDASKPAYYAWLRWQNDADFVDRGTAILDNHPMLGSGSRPGKTDYLPLAQLIETFRSKLCTDPRDRIYALFGITNSKHCPSIDYKCSIELLLLRIMRCLVAEAEERDSCQDPDYGHGRLWIVGTWWVACAMQSLETTAEMVRKAVATSLDLAQGYKRHIAVKLQAFELLLPCAHVPENLLTSIECTSIRSPSGQIEHFWNSVIWFGQHFERRFLGSNTGTPILICSIGVGPTLLLSIDTHRQVKVERLLCIGTSRKPHDEILYKSRHVSFEFGQALNRQLNTLKTDWQDVFAGRFFDLQIHLSYLELVELADVWDLSAEKYDPNDRNIDWISSVEVYRAGSTDD